MGTRIGSVIGAFVLLTLSAGPLVSTVAAGDVSYNFTGTIQTVSNGATIATGVTKGDKISGSFSYDPTQSGSNGTYHFTGSAKTHTFSFIVTDSGGNQVFKDFYTGNVTALYSIQVTYGYTSNPLYPGVNGTELDIKGDTLYNQGLGASPGFDLRLFDPGNVGTSPSNPLPDSSLINNFVSNGILLNWGQSETRQTFTATFNFSTVPEPSSLLLGIVATLTCAIVFSVSKYESDSASRSGRRSAARPHR
jgi:hypothetical protein